VTRVDYDERQHAVYSKGRALTPEARVAWVEAFGSFLAAGNTVLDLGSGTGRFSRVLAEDMGVDVIGVEPSEKMRAAAQSVGAHPGVRYLAGRAESIPVPSASVDAVLISDVLHHVGDLDASLVELRRVLRPRGLVLIRGLRPERLPDTLLVRCFPGIMELVEADRALSTDDLRGVFGDAGFRFVERRVVSQLTAPSLRAYADRTRLRAISHLERLDDVAFARGLEELDRLAAAETVPRPVVEGVDLVVFAR
jgi:ubiquinone/menaquinone biosynthesis C-methylase UbiE